MQRLLNVSYLRIDDFIVLALVHTISVYRHRYRFDRVLTMALMWMLLCMWMLMLLLVRSVPNLILLLPLQACVLSMALAADMLVLITAWRYTRCVDRASVKEKLDKHKQLFHLVFYILR